MKTKFNSNQKNIICGAAVCVLAALLLYYTRTRIKINAFISGFGTDARTVPTIIFGFMFLMGLLLIVDAVLRNKKGYVNTKEFKWIPKDDLRHMAVIILAIVVYAVLTQIIGYFVMTAIYMAFLFWYTKLSLKATLAITVCVDVALYLLFVVALNVPITMNVLLI